MASAPLPRGWKNHIKSSLLHAISLAAAAMTVARRGSYEQAAQALAVDEQTLKSWLRRVDEEGERALVQLAEPVNRFPHFVRYVGCCDR